MSRSASSRTSSPITMPASFGDRNSNDCACIDFLTALKREAFLPNLLKTKQDLFGLASVIGYGLDVPLVWQ